MSAATRIAGKDLRLRMRDRSVFLLAIVVPLALSFIFDAVFGDAFQSFDLNLEYGVVDEDDSEISRAFVETLEEIEADGILQLTRYDDAAAAEAAVEDAVEDAFFLIEPGLGSGVLTGAPSTIRVVGDVDAPTATQIAGSIAEQFASGVAATQLAIQTSATVGDEQPTPEQIAVWTEEAVAAGQSFAFVDESAATRQLDAPTYFAASMAVFFLFFTVQFGVSGLLEEEREGTLARLMAAPIGRLSVVAGKAILAFIIGVTATVILIIATKFLIGAVWGAPLGVALLVLGGVLCAIGIMGLVASVAKSPEGAGNMGAIVAVLLGMLGGVFFPVGSGDDFLSKLSYLTPHAWFLRGLGDLADGAPWTAALPAVGALLLFAVVTGAISWFLLARRYRG